MSYFGYNLPLSFNMPTLFVFGNNFFNPNIYFNNLYASTTTNTNNTAVDTFENKSMQNYDPPTTLNGGTAPNTELGPKQIYLPKFILPQVKPPILPTLPNFSIPNFTIPAPPPPSVSAPAPAKIKNSIHAGHSLQTWNDINNLANKTSWLDIDKAELKKGREARRRAWNRNKNISKPELNTHRNDSTVKALNNYLSTLNLQYDDVKAHELANNVYQGSMGNKSYGYCFAFVKMGLEETFDDIGYLPGVSASEAPGIFQNDKQVGRHLTKLPDNVVKELDFNKLPAGCIVIYKPGNTLHKSEHGHIEVALGNGNSCSDYIKSTNSGQIPRNAEQWKNVEVYVPTMPA